MANSSSQPVATRETLKRYAIVISDLIHQSTTAYHFAAEVEDVDHLQVERGAMFATFLDDPAAATRIVPGVERLIAAGSRLSVGRFEIVDRLGHERLVYRPLLVYSWLQAFRAGYEGLPRTEFGAWEEATRAWCDDLEYRLGNFAWPADALPAARGDEVAEMCWTALALEVAGKVFIRDAWTDLAGDVFGKLVRRQQENGAFLSAAAGDNPETLWFHEVVILHAAASYAVQTEDRALASAVAQATLYQQAETQIDHATNQPWGLFAFLWNPPTVPMADGLLHAVTAHAASADDGVSGLTLMLLADALYCLRLFKL
jgi:hypothetical protein